MYEYKQKDRIIITEMNDNFGHRTMSLVNSFVFIRAWCLAFQFCQLFMKIKLLFY